MKSSRESRDPSGDGATHQCVDASEEENTCSECGGQVVGQEVGNGGFPLQPPSACHFWPVNKNNTSMRQHEGFIGPLVSSYEAVKLSVPSPLQDHHRRSQQQQQQQKQGNHSSGNRS